MKKNVEVEGGEVIYRNEQGDIAIIPKNLAEQAQGFMDNDDQDGMNNMIRTLPTEESYAEDGTFLAGPVVGDPPEGETLTQEQRIANAEEKAEVQEASNTLAEEENAAAEERANTMQVQQNVTDKTTQQYSVGRSAEQQLADVNIVRDKVTMSSLRNMDAALAKLKGIDFTKNKLRDIETSVDIETEYGPQKQYDKSWMPAEIAAAYGNVYAKDTPQYNAIGEMQDLMRSWGDDSYNFSTDRKLGDRTAAMFEGYKPIQEYKDLGSYYIKNKQYSGQQESFVKVDWNNEKQRYGRLPDKASPSDREIPNQTKVSYTAIPENAYIHTPYEEENKYASDDRVAPPFLGKVDDTNVYDFNLFNKRGINPDDIAE